MHFFTVCLSLILGLSVIVQAAPLDANTRGFELNVRSSTASNVSVPSGETNHPQDPRQGTLVYVHFSWPIDIYHEGVSVPAGVSHRLADYFHTDPDFPVIDDPVTQIGFPSGSIWNLASTEAAFSFTWGMHRDGVVNVAHLERGD
ncbi:hypothetical protein F5876DRAFT_67491 [Lentinula aff. lateritia]|uniref:Uncharacterized protein n=1 Tax=Lentinula aff. lateritia TaxID=2804960 RepID=A0ACC1TTT6_9AGAR|nr:hypothetical protein F5876DRAFT_67491 [Lentinula aff. lateritia]